MSIINSKNSIILIIDIQEKLVSMLAEDNISDNAAKLVRAGRILEVPVVVTEQYPKGLGTTLEKIRQEAAEETVYFEKTSFSAMQEPGFQELLAGFNRNKILVCGVETHICVCQTAVDLVNAGYDTEVACDITASRSEYQFSAGIEKMKQLGVRTTSLEMALFELLGSSRHPDFKEIQGLIK